MEEIKKHIYFEMQSFADSYSGAQIVDELIELRANIDLWIEKKKQSIKDYYWTRHKEENLSIAYTYKTFKLRLVFYPNATLSITFEHSFNHTSLIDDKEVRRSIFADPGYVYFIESKFGWKVGKTRDIVKRTNIFSVKLPFNFIVRYIIKTHDITGLERDFHKLFDEKKINGEWYKITANDIREAAKLFPELRLKTFQSKNKAEFERDYLTKI